MRAMTIEHTKPTPREVNAQISAGHEGLVVSSLEHENAGLRKILIELLEENQKLRQQVNAATTGN